MNKIAVDNPFDKNVEINKFDHDRGVFINSFGRNNIFCYNNNPRVKLSGMNHTTNIDDIIAANIKTNADAYFYVNGHRKKDEVKVVRACYVDLDAGRDDKGQYHAPKKVMKIKEVFLKKISEFGVKPSWIVDTRNGYQLYWILNDKDHKLGLTANKKYWNGIQKKLANYFNADIRAMKINQIFRIPFTWWRKPWEGKTSYFSTLLSGYHGETTSLIDLQNALTGQSAQIKVKATNSSDAWYEKIRSSNNTSNDSTVVVDANVAERIMNELISTPDVTLSENDDIPDYEDDVVQPSINQYVPSDDEMKLLTDVVNFLNQVATPLFFSNNKFLSTSARELAAKVSDKFCVG